MLNLRERPRYPLLTINLIHTTDVAVKASHLLRLIRSFDYLDPDMLIKLFVTVVHPTLEYQNSVWGLLFVLDQGKLKRFSVELQDCYDQLETNLMG